MKIMKIDYVRTERRAYYDIPDMDLMKFGGEHIFKMKLASEDSEVLDWLNDEMPDDHEPEEKEEEEMGIYDTEWMEDDIN